MTKKRYNIGISKDLAIAGKKMAVELEIPFNSYLEELIRIDLKYRLVEQLLNQIKEDSREVQ